MRVEMLYIDGCPNHRPLVERVKKVLQQERISVPCKSRFRMRGRRKRWGS